MPLSHLTKSSNAKKSYKEWMNSEKAVKELKRDIEKVGFPLEIAVIRQLEAMGYREEFGRYYYNEDEKSGTSILREIDINLEKEVKGFVLHNCKIDFRLRIIGECKYSSTNDFFVFDSSQRSLYGSFPITLDGKKIFESGSERKWLSDFFSFPSIIEKIAEVDVEGKQYHESDRTVFGACLQILDAVTHYVGNALYGLGSFYLENDDANNFVTRHSDARKRFPRYRVGDELDKKTMDKALTSFMNEFLEGLGWYEISLTIPLMVIGRNNGLIRVQMQNDQIAGFEDIGYGIYYFRPPHPTGKIENLDLGYGIPIVICNEGYLPKLITNIENSITALADVVKETLNRNPILLYDMVSELIDIGRKDPNQQ